MFLREELDMETVIVYYTFGGSTKKEANVCSGTRRSLMRVWKSVSESFWAPYPRLFLAMRRKPVAIEPLGTNLQKYDRSLSLPVWRISGARI